METITHIANKIIEQVIRTIYENSLTDFSKYRTTKTAKADFQFSQIGSIAKLLNLKPKDVAENIHNCLFKQDLIEFVETVKTEKQIFLSMITANKLKKTLYSEELINSEVTLNDFFK